MIATLLNAHDNTELVNNTIFSLRKYVTENVLVIVDGYAWSSWGQGANLAAYKMEGLKHGYYRAPYRNLMLGLLTLHRMWPKAEWYQYVEYDVVFTNDSFKEDLDGWCVGFDARTESYKLELVERIMKTKFNCSRYLLGCCVFYNGDFIRELAKQCFFDRLLYYTNDFSDGFFPGFTGYDVGEHILPTVAHSMGGKITGLSSFDEKTQEWSGNYRKYPVRFRPEITDLYSETSIIHPVKSLYHPSRQNARI